MFIADVVENFKKTCVKLYFTERVVVFSAYHIQIVLSHNVGILFTDI